MKVSLIVAAASNGAIGKDNKLIWHLPADLAYFKKLTTGHAIVMGRKTFESIGKPLPNRTNIVITRNSSYKAEGTIIKSSLQDALSFASSNNETETFVIGGAQVFEEAEPIADYIYLTEVHQEFEGDTFFKPAAHWKEIRRENHKRDEKNPYDYSFVVLSRTSNT